MKLKALVVATSLALSGLASAQTIGVPSVAIPSYVAPVPADIQGKLSLARDDKGYIAYQNELTHNVTAEQMNNAYQQLAQGFWLGSIAFVDAHAQAVDAYNNAADTQTQAGLFSMVANGGPLDSATANFVSIANTNMAVAYELHPTVVNGTVGVDGSTNVSLLEQSNRYTWATNGQGTTGSYTGTTYGNVSWTGTHVAGEPFAGVVDVTVPPTDPVGPVVDVPGEAAPAVE